MQGRPLIGISCDADSIVDRRGTNVARYLLQASYVDAVEAGGGDPVLLPHLDAARAPALIAHLDGLVISGGDFDVPPEFYGQKPHDKLGGINAQRSRFEQAALRAALEKNLPVLGICGGMQLLNVTLGGTLFQDLSLRPGTAVHQQAHEKRQPHHEVRLASGSLVCRLCGGTSLQVNSTHHQIVDRLGDGLSATGVAPDGVPEAIELAGRRFVLGVQWHPEAMLRPEQGAIYRGLVEAARDQNPSK